MQRTVQSNSRIRPRNKAVDDEVAGSRTGCPEGRGRCTQIGGKSVNRAAVTAEDHRGIILHVGQVDLDDIGMVDAGIVVRAVTAEFEVGFAVTVRRIDVDVLDMVDRTMQANKARWILLVIRYQIVLQM